MPFQSTLEINQISNESNDKIVVMPFQQQDIEMHDHNFFELAYVTGGSAVHQIESLSAKVQKGDYFIIDYGIRHSYSQCKNFTLINCLFLPEMIDDTLSDCRSFEELLRVSLIRCYKWCNTAPVNKIFHDDDGSILHLIQGMQEEYTEKKVGYIEISRCRLTEILIRTMRSIIHNHTFPIRSTAVLDAIQYLNRHYREKAVLSHFCQEHHYSEQYVSRKFKQETHMTFLEYLQKIRIEKSCELLASSDIRIHEAAFAVGYEDVKFYHNLFKRMLKMTPKEYQKLSILI